jgi:tight adherence protein C
MQLEALISLLSFSTVMLMVIGLAMKSEHAIVKDRIRAFRLPMPEDYEKIAPELNISIGERVFKPWLRNIANTVSRIMPATALSEAEQKLEGAGQPFKLTAAEFLGLRVLSIIVFGLAGIAAFVLADELKSSTRLLVMLFGFILGILLPTYLLDNAVRNRQITIRKSLPDTLDLLVVSAEAGLGFDGAVARVVDKVRGPISVEFRKVLEEMQVGKNRTEALKSMANRVGVTELSTFSAAMYQADILGVSIAQVLRVQAETLRSQRNLRAREAAAKMPVKMLFPLIFFIFPAIFVVLLGPAAIRIFDALTSINK